MIRTSAPRAVLAAAAAVAAGLVTAQIQCSGTEGMDGDGWTKGVVLIAGAVAIATLLAHRWWSLWAFVALTPVWVSLVDCVSNDPTSDGMEVLYYPTEAVFTAGVVVMAFAIHRAMSGRSAPTVHAADH